MTELAESTATAVTAEVDSGAATADSAGSAPAGTEAATSGDDRSSWTEKAQKRYDELTEARYRESARADRESYRREQLERELSELRAGQAKTETVAPSDKKPTYESCGFDEAKFDAELDAWYDRKFEAKAEGVLTAREKAQQERQTETEWERRESEFIKSKPDYREKVYREAHEGGPSVTDDMAAAAKRRGNGAEVLYYLAENVEKSREIARMHPLDQIVEIGRIEARLEAAKAAPPPVSKAPAPTPKLEGEATVSKAWNDPGLTQTEFNKRRREYLARNR